MTDTVKKRQYSEILRDTALTSTEKKTYMSDLLTIIGGDDCPLEALSLIMGRNYNLCLKQMETLQELVDLLGNTPGALHQQFGLKHEELIRLLIDCDIIIISMKLFAAQLGKWHELANCGKDVNSSLRMTTCLIRVRFDCLLIVSFLCNNSVCCPQKGSEELYQLCKTQLLTCNIFSLLVNTIEHDPSVVVAYYSMMLLDNLTDRYFKKHLYEKIDHQLSLVKLGRHLYKDTLSSKMFTWIREGHASDCETQYLVGLSDDGIVTNCWKSPADRCSPQTVRDCALKWCSFAFIHCASTITNLISLHLNKKILRTFVTDDTAFKGVIKWASIIPVVPEDLERTKTCIKLILTILEEYDVVVDMLFADAEFMQAMQLGVRHADSTLATYFIMCVGAMAKKNSNTRKKLTNEKNLLTSIVRSCCAADHELQTVAIFTLFNLVDRMTATKIVNTGFNLRILKFLHRVYHASDNVSAILINLRCRLERYTTSTLHDDSFPKSLDSAMTPNEMMSKKEHGNFLYKNKQFQEAADLYTMVLEFCPPVPPPRCGFERLEITDPEWYTFPAALYSNRAQCYLMLKNYDKAIADCDEAIVRCDGECGEAHTLLLKSSLRRSTAFYEKQMWTEALLDISYCVMEDPNNSNFKSHFTKVFKKYCQLVGTSHIVKRCVMCLYGEGEKLKHCANCKERYCSRLCQKKAWVDGHKNECNKKQDEV